MDKLTDRTHWKILYFCSILIFFINCSEDNPIQPPQKFAPEISNLIAPEVVYNLSPTKHVISVKAVDPQGLDDLDQVRYTITKIGSSSSVATGNLVDDGTQGDIIPKDGVFTTQIDGSFAQSDSGEFSLEVVAEDASGNTSNTLEDTILVLSGTENLPPEIIKVVAPNTVAVDSTFNFVVTVEVSDPEGLSDIQEVKYQFFPPAHPNPTLEDSLVDNGQSGDVTAGDGVYSTTLSSGLFKEASDYFIRFQAQDKAGNKSRAEVVTMRGIFIRPRAPVISNLVAPDTVQIDPDQVTKILITVDVMDPQGLSDIDYVQFRSFLPNGQEATDSPFQMADDGNTETTGDAEAGDGTYSIIVNLPPTGVTPGDFTFVFQAKDRSNLFSNVIEHTMTVIE
ncbi:MAG: choice-of-anchor X domain-containing protein [bacterium]